MIAAHDRQKGSELLLAKINGGAHIWPGGKGICLRQEKQRMTRDIPAGEEAWKFFSGRPM